MQYPKPIIQPDGSEITPGEIKYKNTYTPDGPPNYLEDTGGTNPGGGTGGGTTEPEPPRWVDEATFLAAVEERNRRQAVWDDLRLNKLPTAELNLTNAQNEYDFRRQFQTLHEERLAATETNAQNLRKENEQKLAGLHTHIVDLFEKTKAAVVQSIAALRRRIHDKLDSIRKRLQEAMSPITGVRGSLDALVEDLFSQHRGNALQAQEYDDKELDAPVYDARDLSAFTYDAEGRLHI